MNCNIEEKLEQLSTENHAVSPCADQQRQYDSTLRDLQVFLAHRLSKSKPKSLLDVGAAYGTLDGFFADLGWSVSAVDAMPELSAPKWWDKHNISFAKANVETDEIPFRQNDLILFTEVIEHLNYSPVPVVQKLYDALKPGGQVICTTPCKELQGVVHPISGRYAKYAHYRDIPLPWNGYTFLDDHHYFYRKHELMQLFHEVGFEIQECYSIRQSTTHYLLARKPEHA